MKIDSTARDRAFGMQTALDAVVEYHEGMRKSA